MVNVFVLVCLALETLIVLFHDSNFAVATIIVVAIQWISALGFRAGDSETAAKFGGSVGVAAIIICLMSLCSRDIGVFLLLCAINFVASLVWGCSGEEDSGTSSTPINSNHSGNEIWEVKKVRRIGKTN